MLKATAVCSSTALKEFVASTGHPPPPGEKWKSWTGETSGLGRRQSLIDLCPPLGNKPMHVTRCMSFTWNCFGEIPGYLLDSRSLKDERLAQP